MTIFSCPAIDNPDDLTPRSLWENPVDAANFLMLDDGQDLPDWARAKGLQEDQLTLLQMRFDWLTIE